MSNEQNYQIFQETVRSLDETERKLTAFELHGNVYEIFIRRSGSEPVQKVLQLPGHQSLSLIFNVYKQGDIQKILLGEIFGILQVSLQTRSIVFQTITASNTGVDLGASQKMPDHVPHLIRNTIKHLLLSGVITEWHSSGLLSEGSERMYELLTADPDLDAIPLPPAKGAFTKMYKLRARN